MKFGGNVQKILLSISVEFGRSISSIKKEKGKNCKRNYGKWGSKLNKFSESVKKICIESRVEFVGAIWHNYKK